MERKNSVMSQSLGNDETCEFIILLNNIKTNNIKMVEGFLEQYNQPSNFDEDDLLRTVYPQRPIVTYVGRRIRTTIHLVLFLIIKEMPEKWEQMLILLIQRNININGTDKRGNTALHLISPFVMKQHNAYMMTKFLLENGADPNIKNVEGRTALLSIMHDAIDDSKLPNVQENSLHQRIFEIIKLFIEYNVNLNEADSNGNTALHFAICLSKCDALISLLIENRVNIDAKNKLGSTPLHTAIDLKNLEKISILLKKGANVHVIDNNGYTPLHTASECQNWKILDVLFKYGACTDIQKWNIYNETPLNIACKLASIQSIKLLVSNTFNAESPKVNFHNPVLIDLFSQRIPNHVKCNSIMLAQIKTEEITQYLLKYSTIVTITSETKEKILFHALNHVHFHDWMMNRDIKSKIFKRKKIINPLLHFDYIMDKNSGKKLSKKTLRTSRKFRVYKVFQKSCKNLLKLLLNYGPNNFGLHYNIHDIFYPLSEAIQIESELLNFTLDLLLSNGYDIHRFAFNKPSLYYYACTASLQGIFYLYHKGVNFVCNKTMAHVNKHNQTFTRVNIRNLMLLIITELQISNRLIVESEQYLKKTLKRNKLCIKEINQMIITKIGCSTITYFEFALANRQRLSTILSNNDIYQIFDNYQYRNYFPNFRYHLEDQFLIGRERMKLLEGCSHIFLTKTVFQSEHIVRLILPHLSNDDLLAMLEAFNPYY